jgi:dipeptidyl aminopeptidase/acylaminoacyl peptidase
MTTTAPYGTWPSPIGARMLAEGGVGLGGVQLDGGRAHWLEGRPTEGGRLVVVREGEDLLPAPLNARTKVHEYGGGSYLAADGAIYFSDFDDQRLHRLTPGGEPEPLTEPGFRYADGALDAPKGRLYLVEEDHTGSGEPVNRIVRLDLRDDGQPERAVIAEGQDFYASPRLSACGTRLAWVSWNHPHMPWDQSEVWIAHLNFAGYPELTEKVAGEDGESAGEPVWSPERFLHFVSDRTGYWNLYRWQGGKAVALCPREADFSKPHWTFGDGSYAFAGSDRLVCTWKEGGTWKAGVLDLADGGLRPLDLPYTELNNVRADETHAVLCAASPREGVAVVRVALADGAVEVLRRGLEVEVDPAGLSAPEPVTFPTTGGEVAHGLFYPPTSATHVGPADGRPPLLVFSHGGPTSSTSTALRLALQFWTSRGFAVLDVNYRGSCGYGRAYRQRLQGDWGIVDVDDCVQGALYLAEQGKVDRERMAIRGGSAGGYTTLCALTFRDVFRAGASHFGVGDLEALAKDTHKFESRYLDGLIGPYPERRDLYVERSPIHHTDGLNCPVILLQGLEDEVVPPNQAETMLEALRAKGIPVAYVAFEGEQHGFRKAESIQRANEAELTFYGRVFGFEPADDLPPLEIENL